MSEYSYNSIYRNFNVKIPSRSAPLDLQVVGSVILSEERNLTCSLY